MGYEINRYDRFVSNKCIEVTQCTIYWYVYYNKLLHKNIEEIFDIMNELKKTFGDIYFVRGSKYTLLVMNIEIKDNTIQVGMVKQLEECIYIFSEDVITLVISTATKKNSRRGMITSN